MASHSACDHATTKQARAACRAGRTQPAKPTEPVPDETIAVRVRCDVEGHHASCTCDDFDVADYPPPPEPATQGLSAAERLRRKAAGPSARVGAPKDAHGDTAPRRRARTTKLDFTHG